MDSRKITVVILLIALSGCATKTIAPSVTTPNSVRPESRIAASLERLEKQVFQLSRIQKARRKIQVDEVIFAPTELLRKIAYYEHYGHLSRIVQDIAEQSGYQFSIVGRAPNIPILVSVKWSNITLIDALKDAGTRAAHRATVVVDAHSGKIEVRYDN